MRAVNEYNDFFWVNMLFNVENGEEKTEQDNLLTDRLRNDANAPNSIWNTVD